MSISHPPMDHYEVLGVGRDATQEEIEKSYRSAAKRLHPDQYPPERRAEYEAKMKELNQAYSELKDPEKRQRYDLGGAGSFSGGGYSSSGGYPGGGRTYSGRVVITTINGNGCLISMGLLALCLILFKYWGILIWFLLNYLLFTRKRSI